MTDPIYESFMGLSSRRIAHWEHWSNPDAATYITGIDFYTQPRSCMLRLKEIYPFLSLLYIQSKTPPFPELRSNKTEERDAGERLYMH